MNLFFASLLLLAQAAAPQLPASQNSTPPKPTVEPSPDPASVHFLGEAGLLLVFIKPASTADYELAIRTLQEALAKQTDPIRVSAAKGWKVFKATEADAKGNAVYVHVMSPTVTGFDYRPSLLLDELVKELPRDLLSKYQDAFAVPPSKLNLTELANMSLAPVKPPEVKKPGG